MALTFCDPCIWALWFVSIGSSAGGPGDCRDGGKQKFRQPPPHPPHQGLWRIPPDCPLCPVPRTVPGTEAGNESADPCLLSVWVHVPEESSLLSDLRVDKSPVSLSSSCLYWIKVVH